ASSLVFIIWEASGREIKYTLLPARGRTIFNTSEDARFRTALLTPQKSFIFTSPYLI
ncbi:MAG: hypothetical protein AVDCRST_MAG95-631, partial [uncultured Adhaeribacter sp.]